VVRMHVRRTQKIRPRGGSDNKQKTRPGKKKNRRGRLQLKLGGEKRSKVKPNLKGRSHFESPICGAGTNGRGLDEKKSIAPEMSASKGKGEKGRQRQNSMSTN